MWKQWVKAYCCKLRGNPKYKECLSTGGNRGIESSRYGNRRIPGKRWTQVLKEARQHLISSFSYLHSGCLVPSTGVEDLLLALWESLVAFPVLWKKNGPCLNSRKCLSSFRIDKKHQPHWLFTVRTNQLLTDPIVLRRLAGAGRQGRGPLETYSLSLFSVLFHFLFSWEGWVPLQSLRNYPKSPEFHTLNVSPCSLEEGFTIPSEV